ncbi:S-layer homology domain-containing protein [Paenibacillus allorhizosphaerae]|uniref:SLH domain-containing protein n=1 Tax=Paenibacillus allorhizosphaerae TaxID=2849866 RepID=A0ABN7TU25_9BACL|nr:S-layer homology domain-containing protein [Paenibacillus allorhizosphaerae]CAG7655796.1 hypothetical protein PAECIP111802_06210 [Paenibacillus allorhizosphaerae]
MGKISAWKRPFYLLVIGLLLFAQLVSGIGGFAGVAAANALQTDTGSGEETRIITVSQAIEEASAWVANHWDVNNTELRDWYVYTLHAAGKTVPSTDEYLSEAKKQAARLEVQAKVTDYVTLALGVKAAGGDPVSFGGINLIERIYNHPQLEMQGINGVIYALLALNNGSYQVPVNATWTQDKLVSRLLSSQIPDQGWALDNSKSDLDLTGAALWALAPYKDRSDVKASVSKATAWIASIQSGNGDLNSESGIANSNTLAYVILGLSAQQIDGRTGSFDKIYGNLLTALFRNFNADGGFAVTNGTSSDKSATYQGLLALLAFNTLTGGQGGEYEVPLPSEGNPQPKASVYVHIEHKDTTLAEGDLSAETPLEALQLLAAQNNLPVETSDGFFFDVTKIGTVSKYVYGSSYDYWAFNIKRDGKWTNDYLWKDVKLQDGDELAIFYGPYDAFKMLADISLAPEEPVAGEPFRVKVTQIENLYSSPAVSVAAAVYVQVGEQKVWTGAQGIAEFPNGYTAADQRIVVTGPLVNGYPTVLRGVKRLTANDNPGPVPGGPVPPSRTITISVAGDDKLGTILSSQSLDWQSGDTAFSVLIRALGAGRVQSKGSGSSAYVSGIDGLREFDKGSKSGWMYAVNCSFPTTSAGGYKINIGDRVDWRYTKNGGDDVKAALTESCTPPPGAGNIQTSPNAASELESNLALIPIGYANTSPVDPKVQTVRVLNGNQKMTDAEKQKLRQTLAANKVALERSASARDAVDLTDEKEEVRLRIPEKALQEDKQLSIQELDNAGGREELISSIYELGPTGTTFDYPVYISIRTSLDADDLTQLAMVWLNEQTSQWIPIPAVIDSKTGVITGTVDHFTKFAVIDKSMLVQQQPADDVSKAIEKAVKYVQSHTELSDWEAYALATAGVQVPPAYIASAESMLEEKKGIVRNVTDYERLAIGVKAAGGDPERIAGYNLIEAIANNQRMTAQGTNGPIFALTVLGSGQYRVSADALWNEDKLIRWLLQAQNSDGGWPLDRGDASNLDLTGMALAALAPYRDNAEVKSAIGKALAWLSSEQQANGGFRLGGQENSESAAQVLLALVRLGIHADDPRFVKSGRTVVTELLSYQQEDGGFAHTKGEPSGSIATEQALLSLAAYQAAKPAAARSVSEPVFADAADISPWAAEYAKKAVRYGLMEGVSDKELRFAPQEKLTRAQFVAMTLRLMGTAPTADVKTAFKDVEPGSWYAGYVAKAAELGIASGISEEAFDPNRSMTRQDMALVLSRAFRMPETAAGKSDPFTDLNEAYEMAVPAIRSVFESGYMEGDDQGRFQPAATVTREMAAAVMVRVYEKRLK